MEMYNPFIQKNPEIDVMEQNSNAECELNISTIA
jgi:hypothetical protein